MLTVTLTTAATLTAQLTPTATLQFSLLRLPGYAGALVPLGGTTHQVLAKVSNADEDIAWTTVDHTWLTSVGSNTHAQIDTALTRLANTSGTNTGDQDLSGLVPKTTTVNGHALSANVTVTASDVGAPSGSGSSTGTNTGDETADRVAALVHGSTSKATPVDADEIGIVDSAASNGGKKLTWANVKATLKTYFDGIYQAALGYIASRAFTRTGVKTSAYTAAPGDLIPVDASGGNVPIALPDLSTITTTPSVRIALKLIAVSGSFAATISTQGSDVFNKAGGSTSATLSLVNQAMTLEGDTVTKIWTVVSADITLSSMDARYGLKPVYGTVADAASMTPVLTTNDTTWSSQVNTQVAGTATLNNPTGTPYDGQLLKVRRSFTNAQTAAFGSMYASTDSITLASSYAAGKTYRELFEYRVTNAGPKFELISVIVAST